MISIPQSVLHDTYMYQTTKQSKIYQWIICKPKLTLPSCYGLKIKSNDSIKLIELTLWVVVLSAVSKLMLNFKNRKTLFEYLNSENFDFLWFCDILKSPGILIITSFCLLFSVYTPSVIKNISFKEKQKLPYFPNKLTYMCEKNLGCLFFRNLTFHVTLT